MFVSASSRCYAKIDFFDACQRIADLEYDKIEIWIDENSDHLKLSRITKDPEAFIHEFRDSSRLTPIAFYLEHDISPEDLTALSRVCKVLRVGQITIPASPMGTPFNTEIDRLRELTKIASRNGIGISIKTKWDTLSEDPHTAVELCQSVQGLGITLDPSYYLCGPHNNESITQIYPHVFHTHLRDTSKDKLQVDTGLGEMDYSDLIGHLEKENYKQNLSVDLLPEFTDEETQPLEMRKLRMLLESLL